MGETSVEHGIFIWRLGMSQVRVARDGSGWRVTQFSGGRLLGPSQEIYSERHKDARYAAWDVMARVIRVVEDEETGVAVARQAAQWMRRSSI